MNTAGLLHKRFNAKSEQVSPVRLRGFLRNDLASLFAELGFTRGAEIGVKDGAFSLHLCQTIPDLQLICVDPWKEYAADPRSEAQEKQERLFSQACEKLKPYSVSIHRMASMAWIHAGCDVFGILDFIFIDANHTFDFVMQDIIEWSKLVRPGGLVSGHDYYRTRWSGVVDAVDAYTNAHQIHEWFLTGNREPSFFWAKP